MSFVPTPSPSPLSLLSNFYHHCLLCRGWLPSPALFVAVAIAIALAAIIIAPFDTHRCAPSPPTTIRICSNGGVGSSLAAGMAVGRRQR